MEYPKVYEIQVLNYKLLVGKISELLIHVMIFVMNMTGLRVKV
jgi:hypothetical protein